nr:hypothetical protein [Algoriphagus marinus]
MMHLLLEFGDHQILKYCTLHRMSEQLLFLGNLQQLAQKPCVIEIELWGFDHPLGEILMKSIQLKGDVAGL